MPQSVVESEFVDQSRVMEQKTSVYSSLRFAMNLFRRKLGDDMGER